MSKQIETRYISIDLVQQISDRSKWTPDFAKLRKKEAVPIFVYDTFKTGQFNNGYLSGFPFLGRGRTCSDNYTMFTRNSHTPIVFENSLKSFPTRGYVLGEVYAVPSDFMLFLDMNRGNQQVVTRKERQILLLDQDYATSKGLKKPYLGCFMYFGNKEFCEKEGINLQRVVPSLIAHDSTKKVYEFKK